MQAAPPSDRSDVCHAHVVVLLPQVLLRTLGHADPTHADILSFLFVNSHHITVRLIAGKPPQRESRCTTIRIPRPNHSHGFASATPSNRNSNILARLESPEPMQRPLAAQPRMEPHAFFTAHRDTIRLSREFPRRTAFPQTRRPSHTSTNRTGKASCSDTASRKLRPPRG